MIFDDLLLQDLHLTEGVVDAWSEARDCIDECRALVEKHQVDAVDDAVLDLYATLHGIRQLDDLDADDDVVAER